MQTNEFVFYFRNTVRQSCMNTDSRQRRPVTAAFTLIELLLVLAIIGTLVAVTVPSLVRSVKGNRLRTSVRTVISMGRYARSMAVLKQKELALTFDLDTLTVYVRETAGFSVSQPVIGGTEEENNGSETGKQEKVFFSGGHAFSDSSGISRRLDGVKVESVEDKVSGDKVEQGQFSIVYRSNGRCQPYAIVLSGDDRRVLIEVDALATARTEEMR